MLSPMLPPITSAAMVGAANAICRTKPSIRPISASPASASIPSSVSRAGGVATSGSQIEMKIAIAPVKEMRTTTGTLDAPKKGAASSAAPTRVIRNTTRQMSASKPPSPKSSAIMALL